MKKIIHYWPLFLVIIAAFLIGFFIGGSNSAPAGAPPPDHSVHEHETEQTWTCSMHPQIRQPKPGKCPICAMDLVPVSNLSDQGESNAGELTLSATAIKLAEIQVQPAARHFTVSEIPLTGKVEYDETRLKVVTSRVPGRIDRLYVDVTGMQVRKGDQLVSLYSPELITAQQELLQALSFRGSAIESVREKLRLWGLTAGQIKKIEKSKKPEEHLPIYSPISGVVTHRQATEGMYVTTGTRLYTIADLSRVWLKLDAYESNIAWLHYGQTVFFETEAYPGEFFEGKIAFIEPVLNPKTRTVKIRVNVPNPKLKLKPGMFVHARVEAQLSASGKVLNKAVEKEAPLLIPVSAPLLTGKRAVVYVKVPGKAGTFIGKQVILGPRAGDYYIVKQGLAEGEEVVVNGAFKIDADLQIQGKPSMMNPEGGAAPGHHHGGHVQHAGQHTPGAEATPERKEPAGTTSGTKIPAVFKESIDIVAADYFAIQHALSSDNAKDAVTASRKLLKNLAQVDMKLLGGQAHMDWMTAAKQIRSSAQKLAKTGNIESARAAFEGLTSAITPPVKRFGSGKTTIYRFHCPMAFNNKGAYWLQNNPDTRNPYFGSTMLLCKDKVEPLIQDKKK